MRQAVQCLGLPTSRPSSHPNNQHSFLGPMLHVGPPKDHGGKTNKIRMGGWKTKERMVPKVRIAQSAATICQSKQVTRTTKCHMPPAKRVPPK